MSIADRTIVRAVKAALEASEHDRTPEQAGLITRHAGIAAKVCVNVVLLLSC